jgi:HPt (histidine-containing phosphotransfer) domain-containing protein
MSVENQLAILDRAIALSRVGGDAELLREMAELFLEEYPRALSDVRAAVTTRNAKAVERAAHSLKGAVGNFGAEAAYRAAFELEMLGRGGDLSAVESHYRKLEGALRDLHPQMEDLSFL